MNNKKHGTEFERRMVKKIAEAGAWVHFLSPDERGAQPFDIIAVKNGVAMAFECKTLDAKKKYFSIDRLEENQIMAFDKWIACGNIEPVILIEWGDKVIFVKYSRLKKDRRVDLNAL